jgi:hypothetical protein
MIKVFEKTPCHRRSQRVELLVTRATTFGKLLSYLFVVKYVKNLIRSQSTKL